MESQSVLFFGGNGHAAVRVERARACLARRKAPIHLVDVPYPGFEGRPSEATRDAFFGVVSAFTTSLAAAGASAAVATGIGGLIALELRARGELAVPLILQAPVLWGLRTRRFPRAMRYAVIRRFVARALQLPLVQRAFVQKQFLQPLDPRTQARFFEGYAICTAFKQLFEWFTPEWLRELEGRLSARPGALTAITVWWGGRDRVVDVEELRATERILNVHWPLVVFPAWGHYPMIDVPEEWADTLADALALSH